MFEFKTIALFVITAVVEIIGYYLPCFWFEHDKSIVLLMPVAANLALSQSY